MLASKIRPSSLLTKRMMSRLFSTKLETVPGLFGDLAFGDIPDKHQGTIFTFELKGDGIDLHIQMAAVHSHKYLLDGRSGFPFLVYLMNAFANDFMKIRMISVHHGLAKELSRIRGTKKNCRGCVQIFELVPGLDKYGIGSIFNSAQSWIRLPSEPHQL